MDDNSEKLRVEFRQSAAFDSLKLSDKRWLYENVVLQLIKYEQKVTKQFIITTKKKLTRYYPVLTAFTTLPTLIVSFPK